MNEQAATDSYSGSHTALIKQPHHNRKTSGQGAFPTVWRKKDVEGQLCATEMTNGRGLLSSLRMGNRMPGEPTPRPEGWTLVP